MKTKITFFLFLALSLTACRKLTVVPEGEIEIINGNGNGNSSGNVLYYVKGNLDGTAFNWKVTEEETSYGNGYLSSSSIGQGVSTGYFGGSITKTGDTFPQFYPSLDIEFGVTKVNFDDDFYAYLKSFVNKGKWNFATIREYVFGAKTTIVNYTDKTGKDYNTLGVQTGSLEITEITEQPAELGKLAGLKLKIVFSCKLYPDDKVGNPINLTNGEAVISVDSDLY